MVAGSWHHALYAHARQCAQKEQSVLRSRAIYLSAREQQLSLSGWGTAQLCRPECSQSCPRLHRQRQTLWGMLTKCTSGRYKYLAIHMHEPARQRARELANTPAFASAQRERKKVEALFAEMKNLIGLRRLRLRRMKFVREQFFLAAVAQNVKRLVRFLSRPTGPLVAAGDVAELAGRNLRSARTRGDMRSSFSSRFSTPTLVYAN